MTPTYGNTLMGLAAERAERAAQQLQDRLLRAAAARRRSRWSTSTIPNQVVGYGETGRVKLTTLTKEFFMPGFLERDEGEREPPCEKYPVGRHQRRPAVPRVRGDDDGRGVLRRSRRITAGSVTQAEDCNGRRLRVPESALRSSRTSVGPSSACFIFPFSAGASPTRASTSTGRALRDRRADRQRQPRQRRADPARHAQGRSARARCCARFRSTI